jgi:WD40 repeat protein
MAGPARSIFVCYRRDDTRHLTGRLCDRLIDEFGPQAVFMDVDTIGPGIDFTVAIDEALRSCRIVLVVIGQSWLTVTGADGRPRIGDPADHVAVEIATALRHGLPVLPVLADGARMPAHHELPSSLAELSRRNAVRVDHESFGRDSAFITDSVAGVVRIRRRPRRRVDGTIAAALRARLRGRPRVVMALLAVIVLLLGAVGTWVVAPLINRTEVVVGRVLSGGHVGAVTAVTTAVRDGRPVAVTAGEDRTIRIWDLVTGKAVGSPLVGHGQRINSVATVSDLDGRTAILSSSVDGTIRLWDLADGTKIGSPKVGSHAANAISTAQLGGLPVVVTATDDGKVFVVDLTIDEEIRRLQGHQGGLIASAIDVLDGRAFVVTLGGDNVIRAWDLATGDVVGEPLSCAGGALCTVVVAELNRQPVLVTAAAGVLRAWDAATGRSVGTQSPMLTDAVTALVAANLDGQSIVAAAGSGGDIQIWDLGATGFNPHGPPLEGYAEAAALAVAEVGTDSVLVAGGIDGSVHIRNLHTVFGS